VLLGFGRATPQAERVVAGGRKIEVARLKIRRGTAGARRAAVALNLNQTRELERLGIVRQKLRYAGAGQGSIVPGLGDGKMLRGDVEDWLAEKDNAVRKRAEKLQEYTLRCAKAAAWIAGAGIVVGTLVSFLAR